MRSIGEDPLPGLKKALDSKDQSLRINTAALMMQVNLDRPLVAPILREALTSKNPDINIQAAVALAGVRQNVDEVVPVLIEGLKNKNAGVRQSAIAGLQSVGAKDAVQATPTLIALLEDTEIGNVVQVVYLIRNLNLDPERTVPPLLKLLTRNDPQLQTAVLQMIANSGDRGLDAAVKVFKESKDANQRSQIIRFLAYSKENRTKAMPLISEAAKDPSPQTRVAVMHLISYLHQRNEETFQIFAGGVNDDAETVRSAAAQAAYIFVANAELSGKAVQLLETRLVAEKDRAVKISLLQGLSNMARKTKTSVPVLVGCLKDDVPQVRWTAAQALANLGAGAKDAIPALESLRDDPDPTVRQIVANAIARIK